MTCPGLPPHAHILGRSIFIETCPGLGTVLIQDVSGSWAAVLEHTRGLVVEHIPRCWSTFSARHSSGLEAVYRRARVREREGMSSQDLHIMPVSLCPSLTRIIHLSMFSLYVSEMRRRRKKC